MRTAKYHDFGALKVAFLFIILVILGLFVYNQFLKPAFFHTADEDAWVVEEPTCEADGRRYKICTDENCGKEFDIEVIPALGHDEAKNATVTKDPTCTEDGAGYKACTRCDKVLETITITALGHTEGKVQAENRKEHDKSTQGVSYDNVVRCTVCNEIISSKKVDEPHVTEIKMIVEIEPTCYAEGSGHLATFCKDCNDYIYIDEALSSIDTAPHTFEMNVIYKNGEFLIASGCCTVEECGHEYDVAVDNGYTLDAKLNTVDSIPSTCISGLNVYNVDVLYLGKKVSQTVVSHEVPATEEHYILTSDGTKVALSTFVNYDGYGRPYYNYSTGLFALVLPERQEGQSYDEYIASAWDENGFGTGTFICTNEVGDEFHHVQVTIYNDKA